ncbi:unnamed protein product [Eruca vesicaria subsp. sativa]|uniref:Uncharacterized protein n=1 Tax=Eruca vesicaria subsp. sativa TaxID=29727 RepID=A0ABC8KI16_ERUVS|nr:unnamed protein product [Eruca vesicaria subsp. sativa]
MAEVMRPEKLDVSNDTSSLGSPELLHVLSVDDSISYKKFIERLLQVSSCKESKIIFNEKIVTCLYNKREILTFRMNCGGYWVKNHKGNFGYFGGEVRTINCKPAEELFNSMAVEFGEGLNSERVV